MINDTKKVAVFIDAENISAANAEQIFDIASNYGDVTIKKIYADWSNESVKPWKDKISKYSIVAEQQFTFASGKNTSDITLMIHVMLALFEKDIDVFCIASGDSDFTRLVQELRERKRVVVGMGAKNTIASYINSFTEFIYLDDKQTKKTSTTQSKRSKTEKQATADPCILEKNKLNAMKDIIDNLIENNGRALYSQISNDMKNKFSDFVPKNYGARSLKDFIQQLLPHLGNYKTGVDKDKTTCYLTRSKN